MDEDKTNPLLEALLAEVAGLNSEYSVDLSDPEFQGTTLGGKMLGLGFSNVMQGYKTADEQADVLNVGLDWVGKQHGLEGEGTRYLVGRNIVKGLLGSGAIKDKDVKTFFGAMKPVTTLLEYFQSNPEISISSGLHELDEERFGPQ